MENFDYRVLEAIQQSGASRIARLSHGQLINRFLQAQETLKVYESVKYTEIDLRGLSQLEKEFVRDHQYKNFIDYEGQRFYYWIRRDPQGRKSLFAYSKKQWLDPNGRSYCGVQNCRRHLVFTKFGFNEFNFLNAWRLLPTLFILP